MPRKLHLESHFSSEQLKARYRACTDPVESRRWHLLWLVCEQSSLTDAAAVVGFNYDYARDIVRAYNQNGAEGLRNRRKDRCPGLSRALLTPEQCAQLRQRLQSPPEDGGIWSGPKVAEHMAVLTGREHVWPQRGWDYLKRLGFSCQRPRPRHVKGDPQAQAAFKKTFLSAKSS
ncbi:MAG: winged helix-turn-helix domain-containing protein [Cyanobacteria bacterium J06639_1]